MASAEFLYDRAIWMRWRRQSFVEDRDVSGGAVRPRDRHVAGAIRRLVPPEVPQGDQGADCVREPDERLAPDHPAEAAVVALDRPERSRRRPRALGLDSAALPGRGQLGQVVVGEAEITEGAVP